MNLFGFLSHLHDLGIELSADGDQLRINAPKDVLTPALRTELAERKTEILALLRQANPDTKTVLPPILPISRNRKLPLSFAQRRLWFLHQLEPNKPIYNISSIYRLKGHLDIKSFKQSINEIVRRHESLRTTFVMQDDQAVQVIKPYVPVSIPLIDLQSLSPVEQHVKVQQIISAQKNWLFDLTQGPLFRATLLKLGAEEHILIFLMHHIISDGWSNGILFQELSTLYTTFSKGQPSPLSELPIQYVDFTLWQREWLQGEVLETQLTYWKDQLKEAPNLLGLPTDRPRPAVQTYRGTNQSFDLSSSLSRSLKAFGRSEHVTLFIVLLAAFKVLLYRYTHQDRLAIGTPIANRNRVELEPLIGFLVNTLVLHTDLSGEPTFRELLARVREVALGAYFHQDLPFEKLVEELQPERVLSYNPLFQVMFTLQNMPRSNLELSGLTVTPLKKTRQIAQVDLTLIIFEKSESLTGSFEYNTDLFDDTTIQRMIRHFQTLLESILAEPDTPITQLTILPEQEQKQLLTGWNDTHSAYPKDKCIHQLFEAQAERTPDAIAVVHEDEQVSYRELNERANQLACYLQKHGVRSETLVGLCVERSIEMMVGMLGILKAGGAYVPLDPTYPQQRIAYILDDTQAPLLLTQERLVSDLPEHQAQLICLDSDWEKINQESISHPQSELKADNLVYVIYTSGSTGKPKGVMIEHQSLVNHSWSVGAYYDLKNTDRVLQFASMSFDVAAEELYPALIKGATVVLRTEETVASFEKFVQFIEKEQLSVLNLPTPFWHEWVGELSRTSNGLPDSLRLVIVGSDKTLGEPLRGWQELVGERVRWCNGYGPTEATITATIYEHNPNKDHRNLSSVPIGRPISNVQLYVLDEDMNPVPIGIAGELYIGGVGVARGYLNQTDLTAEKFITNPFSDGNERLYKTGDMVRYLADRNLEFLGRVDDQVKIRGFRIELGEIETALNQHERVQECIVIAREDESGHKVLVAYIVPVPNYELDLAALRSYLKERLPAYMVPATFVFLEKVPISSNGKVDRGALPAPDSNLLRDDQPFVPPQSPVEQDVANIWSEILKLDRVSIRDNFFELGGHSLLAMQVISRLQNSFQVEVSLRDIFEKPTVAELALEITRLLANEEDYDDLMQLVAEIKDLSEDELKVLLNNERE